MQPNGETSVTWGKLRQGAEDAMRPLPLGTRVPVVVTDAEYKRASTGADMVTLKLAVFEGDHINRKFVNVNFVLSPDNPFAMTMFFRRMDAFGINDQVFSQLENVGGGTERHLTIIADLMVQRKAWLTMGEPREYQGTARDNPDRFDPYPGQPPVQFNAGLAAATGGVPGGNAGGPPVPQASASPASAAPTPGASPAPSAAGSPPPVPSF